MTSNVKEMLTRVYSGSIMMIWIMAPYLLLQQFAIRDVYWMPLTWVDRLVSPDLRAAWFYFSYFGLLALVALSVSKPIYLRFLLAVGWSTLVAHMVFLLFPTGLVRDAFLLENASFLYEIVLAYDAPRNVFPSLHVTLSVVAAIAVTGCYRYRWWMRTLIWLWVIGILWSTLALRQHVMMDLVSGGLLGILSWYFTGWFHRDTIAQMRDK